MEGEELGGTFVVAVEELGMTGLWTTIRELLESRSPLQGLTLPNKYGTEVAIGALPLVYVLSNDKRVLRLKQYSHSPVTWFRNPITHLILVSTADPSEYRLTVKAQLKKVTADIEKDWGASVGCEWLILYVRPFELDPGDKGASKVMEKLVDDFGSKKRRRVVRLDVSLRAFANTSGASVTSSVTPSVTTSGGSVTSSAAAAAAAAVAAAGAAASQGGLERAGLLPVPGVSDYCAALRESIRGCFEVRQEAYVNEVRKLLNERREPSWSFTTLYLVKDSGALLREGAGLWEDAFSEYVELEECYADTLKHQRSPAGSAAGTAAAAGGAADALPDFGVSGDSEDASTLLTANWRSMRRLVLWKKAVPEYAFRQYLFAAQARVLLRLGRPLEVAERGLNFIQNFLELLAAREEGGQLRPWFKERWAFSACMSLISAVTSHTAAHGLLPAGRLPQAGIPGEWDPGEVPWTGPASRAAQEALKTVLAQQGQVPATPGAGPTGGGGGGGSAGRAGAGAAAGGSGSRGSTDKDASSRAGPPPYLPPDAWELGSPVGQAEVAKLDPEFLGGQAITPTMLSLVGLGGQQHGELLERLYHCLLGHLYHLARGQLLRLGTARGMSGPSSSSGDIMLLGRDPPPLLQLPGAGSRAVAAAALRGGPVGGPKPSTAPPAAAGQRQDGVALVAAAAASGVLSPPLVAACQELLGVPLCAYSCLVAKVADGAAGAHAYDVQTPRRPAEDDPLAAALSRTDSLSSPYHHQPGSATSSSSNPVRGSHPGGASSPSAASGKASMFDRLLRSGGGGSPSGSQGGGVAGGGAAGGGGGGSRLARTTGEVDSGITSGEGSLTRTASTASLTGGVGGMTPVPIGGSSSGTGGGTVNAESPGEDGTVNVPLSAAASPRAPHEIGEPAEAALAPGNLHARTQSDLTASSVSAAAAAVAAAGGAASAVAGGPSPALRPIHLRSASEVPQSSGKAGSGPGSLAAARGAAIGPLALPGPPSSAASAVPMSPAAAAAAASLPARCSEWRLKLALSSSASYESLVVALCQCAAGCYTKCGRVRSAALIYLDIAVLSLQQGDVEAACRLLQALLQAFITEGWQLLLGRLLPKALACQRLASSALLPYTAVRTLGLPAGLVPQQYREAAFQELCTAVGVDPAAAGQARAVGGTAGHRNSISSSSSSKLAGPLACLSALQLMPAAGSCSSFYGTEDTQGRPVLVPPSKPYWRSSTTVNSSSGSAVRAVDGGGSRGAVVVAAGDLLLLPVQVVSNLPQAIAVNSVTLTLVQLHKGSWVSAQLTTGSSMLPGMGSASSLMTLGATSGNSRGMFEAGMGGDTLGRGAFGSSDTGTPVASSMRWQEGEELLAARLVAAPSYPSSSSSSSSRSSNRRKQEGSAAAAAASAAAAAAAGLKAGWVVLYPGANTLVFEVAPHQQGLYCLKHLDAVLGTASLRIGLAPCSSLPRSVHGSRSIDRSDRWSNARSTGQDLFAPLPQLPDVTGAGAAPLGSCTFSGTLEQLQVVAEVLPACSRVAVQPVLLGTSLLVGQLGWVGLLIEATGTPLTKPWLHVAAGRQLGFLGPGGGGMGASLSDGGARNSQGGGLLPQVPSEGARMSLTSSIDFTGLLSGTLPTAASTGAAAGGGSGSSSSAPGSVFVANLLSGQPSTAAAAAGGEGAAPNAPAGALTTSTSSSGGVGVPEGVWLPVGRSGIDLAAAAALAAASSGAGAPSVALPLPGGDQSALASPVLVWVPVMAGSPARPPDVVTVLPWDAPRDTHHLLHHVQQQQQAAAAGRSSPDGPRNNAGGAHTDPAAAAAQQDADVCGELMVQLQFHVGMWRAHSQLLLLPLTQPFSLTSRAVALPQGQIALELLLTTAPSCSVLVKEVSLVPQLGLAVVEGPQGAAHCHLPLLLQPGASAALTFLLTRAVEDALSATFQSDHGCSMVQLFYSVHRATAEAAVVGGGDGDTPLPLPPSTLPPPAAAAGGVGGLASSSSFSARLSGAGLGLEQSSSGLPAPLSGSSSSRVWEQSHQQTAGAGGGQELTACDSASNLGAAPVLTHSYCFTLNFPHCSDVEEPQLSLLLLGPVAATVGQPTCMTWQVRRLQQPVPLGAVDPGLTATGSVPQQGGTGLPTLQSTGSGGGLLGRHSLVAADGGDDTIAEDTLYYELVYEDPLDPAAAKRSPTPAGGTAAGGGRVSPAPQLAAVAADGSPVLSAAAAWDPRWRATGSIRLSRVPDALAVVEAVVVPRASGQVLPPRLVVHGPAGRHGGRVLAGDSRVGRQEVDAITISPG